MINRNNFKKIKNSIINYASIEDIIELAALLKERKNILELPHKTKENGLAIKKITKKD